MGASLVRPSRRERDVVLVGGGHAHALVLLGLARTPLRGARLTLVSDGSTSIYSGMVPGVVEGRYQAEETTIDLASLCARAGARLVPARAVRISAATRLVECADGVLLPFDALSLDVGSSIAGLDLPGVREHALPTRPMAALLAGVPALVARARAAGGPFRAVVVGGGAGGIELASALRARFARESVERAEVSLLEASGRLLGGRAPRVAAGLLQRLRRLGVAVETGVRVVSVDPGRLVTAEGDERPFDALLWATGAAPNPLLSRSDLPRDGHGHVRVGPTLEVAGFPGVFAAGDVAGLRGAPELPRAGVYAVREAPVVEANLRAFVSGGRRRSFRPQRDALVLLNLGNGRALGFRHGRALEGRLVMRLKDWIDRRFVARFAFPADQSVRRVPPSPRSSAERPPVT